MTARFGGHVVRQAPLSLHSHSCFVQSEDCYPVTAGLGENFMVTNRRLLYQLPGAVLASGYGRVSLPINLDGMRLS